MAQFLRAFLAFAKAIGVGVGIVSGLSGLVVGVLSQSVDAGVYAFVVTGIMALFLMVIGGVVVGLPLTFLLDRFGFESRRAYGLAGAVTGFLAFPAFFLLTDGKADGFLFGPVGAVAGAIVGSAWWKAYRRAEAARARP